MVFVTYASISMANALQEFPTGVNIDAKPNIPLKTVRILSLDGGGVRGIVEARFLQHLEERLQLQQDEVDPNIKIHISDLFHIIGGTSAGGMLATFLTIPKERGSTEPKYFARDLVQMLLSRSSDMFVPRYLSLSGLFGPKYSTDHFRTVLAEYCGRETTNNVTTHTAVIACDIVRQNLKIINSWDKSEIFTKVDAISSSAAATSFFQPCHTCPLNAPRRSYVLTDGGTGANNPTLCLLTKAMELYPNADSFEIVSIGSGSAHKPLFYQEVKDAGLIDWVKHLPRIFMAGQTTKDDSFLKAAFSRTDSQGIKRPSLFKGNYTRWNPLLNSKNTKMDNTDEINLLTLISVVDRYFEDPPLEFNTLIERLISPKTIF